MSIGKRRGPKIDPSSTPTFRAQVEEDTPIKTLSEIGKQGCGVTKARRKFQEESRDQLFQRSFRS